MTPLKWLRKLGSAIRGGATPRQIFLGVFLGFAVGMTPGVNLTMIIFLLLLLLLNINGVMAVVALILGKLLCHLLAPVTFHIGYALIHTLGLAGLVRALADTPVLALLDWQVYCVIGSLPLIIIVGGALAASSARGIIKIRRSVLAAQDHSQSLQTLGKKRWVRILLWLAMGKQKGTLEESLTKKAPLIRKGRLIGGIVVLALFLIAAWLFLDSAVRRGIEVGASTANGAEVNLSSAGLSLLKGQLTLEGLQVTNPAKPQENRVQAERIVADMSIGALLTRRFEIDLISCEAMKLDAPRSAPGEVYRKAEPEAKPGEGLLDKLSPDAAKAKEYWDRFNSFKKNLDKARSSMEGEGEKPAEKAPDKAKLVEEAKTEGYFRLSAQDVLAKHPSWMITRLEVNNVEILPGAPPASLVGENLSSDPALAGKKPKLYLKEVDAKSVQAWASGAGKSEKKETAAPQGQDEPKKEEKKKGVLDLLKK